LGGGEEKRMGKTNKTSLTNRGGGIMRVGVVVVTSSEGSLGEQRDSQPRYMFSAIQKKNSDLGF